MSGKYASPRDEALHLLCTLEWANESTGNVEAPTGYVWRITITEAELSEITGVLEGEPVEPGVDPASLVGAWLITEDSQGFVTATDWSTDEPARTFDDRQRVQYRMAERAYDLWAGGDNDSE